MDNKQTNIIVSDLLDISNFFMTKNPKEINVIFDKINEIIPITSGIICKIHLDDTKFKIKNYYSYNIDERFLTAYQSYGMVEIDSIMRFTYNHSIPIQWSDALSSVYSNSKFTQHLNKYNLYDGIAYMHKDTNTDWLTYFCLGYDDIKPIHSLFIRYLAPYIHNTLKFRAIQNVIKSKNISKREIEVLQWVADGKTYWEISKILTISERTVRFHIGNIISKLNANNNVHAISKAIRLNILISNKVGLERYS